MLSVAMLSCFPAALAAPEGPSVPPSQHLAAWVDDVVAPSAGSRVAAIVEVEAGAPPTIEVFDGRHWVALAATWSSGRVSVHAGDLTRTTSVLRFRSADAHRITTVDWELFAPTAGEPRREAAAPPPAPGVLPAELVAIGVVSRSAWGADPTTCTSTEDDWYRMAIHHTAGSQTYGGTVQGAVQALQAYAFSTGEYCDIPYQFLVGYDGSLWEGRPYDYYSGATGGGNNDGNIAVCFLGCYHPSGCSTSHSVTEEMMDGGQLLVQTLAELHAVPSDDDSIRGHRDWPDNATACPGDWLYDRLDELREPLGPSYAATLSSLTCTPGEGAALSLATGESAACTLDFLNSGRESWTPGVTKLAPIPRDEASPLAASSWLHAARIVSVGADTPSGAVGSFGFDVYGASEGDYTLALGLVEEGVIWFADDGGPADGEVALSVTVRDPESPGDTGPGGGADSAVGASGPGQAVSIEEIGGCGYDQGGRNGLGAAALAAVALAGRRLRPRALPVPLLALLLACSPSAGDDSGAPEADACAPSEVQDVRTTHLDLDLGGLNGVARIEACPLRAAGVIQALAAAPGVLARVSGAVDAPDRDPRFASDAGRGGRG